MSNVTIHQSRHEFIDHISVMAILLACLVLTPLVVSAADEFEVRPDPLARLAATYSSVVKPGEKVDSYRELLGTIFQRVQRSYAREVDVAAMTAAAAKTMAGLKPESGEAGAVFKDAINAALAVLDPHTRYLDPVEQQSSRTSISGSFGGLGIEVDLADGLVRVVNPMDDSPAARAGLRSGDLIVQFDDQPVQGMSLADAVSHMRGQPGTAITLLIRRPGVEEEFSVSLVREVIRSQVLRWSMENDVLVLKLARFTNSVGQAIERAVKEASVKHTPRGVVLDMRNNPGGLLNQAIVLADAFLGQGEIVSLRGRSPANRRTWTADPEERLAGLPMVVLINRGSASAAELVAAALQENGRAVVMGQRSYGKGSVQTIIPLGAERGALRLTTALYYGPSGRTVQRGGVGPDIEVYDAAAAASRVRREADRAQALPGGDEPAPPKARVDQAQCAGPKSVSDAVLACALAFIKAGAINSFVASLQPTVAVERVD